MATETQTSTAASHKVYSIIGDGTVLEYGGIEYSFNRHTLIHEDHPIRIAYPDLFQLARLNYTDVEDATANPGRKRG